MISPALNNPVALDHSHIKNRLSFEKFPSVFRRLPYLTSRLFSTDKTHYPKIPNSSFSPAENVCGSAIDNTVTISDGLHTPHAALLAHGPSHTLEATQSILQDGTDGFTVFLKGITSGTLTLFVYPSSCAADIRTLLIRHYPSLSSVSFQFYFDSSSPAPLPDDCELSAMGIEPMATLHLRFSVLGGYYSDTESDKSDDSCSSSLPLAPEHRLEPVSIFPRGFTHRASCVNDVNHLDNTPCPRGVLKIPPPARIICDPAPSLSVPTFMQLTCAVFSPAVLLIHPALDDTDHTPPPVFSDLDPNFMLDTMSADFNSTLELIAHICIRHRGFFAALSSESARKHVGSILIPHIDPQLRFPPWITHFIHSLNALSSVQSASTLVAQTHTRLRALDWNTMLPGFTHSIPLFTLDCAALLGTSWVSSDIIDACGEYLIMKQHFESRAYIANTHIVRILQGLRATTLRYNKPPHLREFDRLLSSGAIQTLFIPIHTPSHWSLLCVDLVTREYWYVDPRSLRSELPELQFGCVRWWLDAVAPGSTFLRTNPPFRPPTQTDTYSCGIIVMSMMAYCILGQPLWSVETREIHRIVWFLLLTDAFRHEDDEVRSALIAGATASATTIHTSSPNPCMVLRMHFYSE
ncbi:hypothetical protein BOTBODRAFT_182187 [Botryobasidium botryosum FD-172 SS1]|uniref:Ubiquitin-like protease family profile domain-containing protein n=1 Tax=Botryobasidium botryosum (strain FD-172 SS1) TaxID=930990 RepID=A0A067LUE3_BOTB1|nr:hypothetical protein BOTBODRAFT_182187 [Botryobasidium botryosum FD-172 SS1]